MKNRRINFLCVISNKPSKKPSSVYLKYENLSGGPVYVEFAVGRIVWIDALSSQEVDNVLGPIFVAIRCGHLNTSTAISTF